jgi:hypothetical protein
MATTPCSKCNGCGKLAAANPEVETAATEFKANIGKPWSQFAGKPYHSPEMKGPRTGGVIPAVCADCEGTGVVNATAPSIAEPTTPAK